MKKTNTKKSTSTKKSPAKAKAVAKKVAPAVITKKSTAPLVSTPVPKKSPASQKKTAPKKVAAKKSATPIEKIAAVLSTSGDSHEAKDGVKMLGILHLVGNLISGGTLGILLVIIYYVFQKDKLSTLEKETCFEIINFNISFLIYTFIAGCSVVILIGIVLLPLVLVTWLVLMLL